MKYIKDGIINDGYELITELGITYNPTPEFYKEHGWKEYVEETPKTAPSRKTLTELKEELKKEAEYYYNSTAVLGFWLNETLMWINREDRVSYRVHLQDCCEMYEDMSLEFEGTELSIESALNCLKQINVYASKCYSVLNGHLNRISEIKSKRDLDSYDYTLYYPEQLEFTIS